jgi:hypothetical protein
LSGEVKKQAKEYGLELTLSREDAKARYFVAVPKDSTEARSLPNNLPRAKTSFIGRDLELIEIGQLLHQSDVRLITLLGPGGMGKTRLALQLAQGQLQEAHFTHGIYFVALDAPAQIPLVIAQTLGLTLQSKDEPLAGVKSAMGNKHMLLVLDNFEQLIGGVLLVSELLESCSNLKLLGLTSRKNLSSISKACLCPSKTVQTFLKLNTTMPLNSLYNAPNVLSLTFNSVQRIYLPYSGSANSLTAPPLGIELAAVWLRSLTPPDLLREIQKSMDGLGTPSHNIVGRHQSLRAVFEHSWKLLKPKEQTTLAMLTVFVGGFSREAAARVTDATIPLLTSLVDKSLLKVNADGRYERHALLYQFAHEKLLADPALHQAMQLNHLAYCATLGEEIAPKLIGSEQALWLGGCKPNSIILEQPQPLPLKKSKQKLVYAWHWHCQISGGCGITAKAISRRRRFYHCRRQMQKCY